MSDVELIQVDSVTVVSRPKPPADPVPAQAEPIPQAEPATHKPSKKKA
jgi:hypothetical protein